MGLSWHWAVPLAPPTSGLGYTSFPIQGRAKSHHPACGSGPGHAPSHPWGWVGAEPCPFLFPCPFTLWGQVGATPPSRQVLGMPYFPPVRPYCAPFFPPPKGPSWGWTVSLCVARRCLLPPPWVQDQDHRLRSNPRTDQALLIWSSGVKVELPMVGYLL